MKVLFQLYCPNVMYSLLHTSYVYFTGICTIFTKFGLDFFITDKCELLQWVVQFVLQFFKITNITF